MPDNSQSFHKHKAFTHERRAEALFAKSGYKSTPEVCEQRRQFIAECDWLAKHGRNQNEREMFAYRATCARLLLKQEEGNGADSRQAE